MEKNSWFLNENELSISLMRFHINIKILKNSDFIYFQWNLVDNERKELLLNFYSLEDAIFFTEEIKDKRNINEIMKIYEDKCNNNDFVISYPKIKVKKR